MTNLGDPLKAQTTRELMKLARRIERSSARRRELVKRLAVLEAELRADKRMLKGLADSIGAPVEPISTLDDSPTCYCGFADVGHRFGVPGCTASDPVPR